MNVQTAIINLSGRSLLTAVAAALVAAGALLGVTGSTIVLALVVLAIALGWPRLMNLPAVTGSSLVMALAGLSSLAVVYAAPREPWIRSVPLVLAFAVVLAFVNELARPDDRSRLTESLLGTVSGAFLAIGVSGWLAADRSILGHRVVVLAALALAVASILAALPIYGWTSFTTTTLAGVATAVALAQVWLNVRTLTALAAGLVAGLCVAFAQSLFIRMTTLRSPRAAIATVAVPLVAAGPFIYAIARLTLQV
ncbi:hypothetical protein SAMN06309944_1167 [Micrococcales bacterium KH10]|nr:hypothetical protein SAMN06309944_1167 [Micrococcales bacterium KH10]